MDAKKALDDLLAGRLEPGVFQWRPPAEFNWVERAEQAGTRVFRLDGHAVRGKESFLRMCSEVFEFPDWFGDNWDALEDCLTDLSWAPSRKGYLIGYEAWLELAEADHGSFRTAVDVFAEAVESWRDSDTPMTVLLLGEGGTELSGVPEME
ncbi:barstar family protein [Actinomadura rudentiformis]|uniref:barstar family protein n=1 Tax=Actinomadura rudentiformis TaxID=359158 RepID=UPI00178C7B40|nr:barstar family protein [Actinomadura rudentiformis]